MKKISEERKQYMKNYLKEYGPKYDKEHPEKVVSRFNKFYCTNKGRAVHMLNSAKQRAKKYKLDFDIDFEFIFQKLEKGVCEVTGIPFVLRTNGGKGHRDNSFSPSLERRDNNKGYTKDNVQVVCWIYNRAKGAFPLEDLLTMTQALLKVDLQ